MLIILLWIAPIHAATEVYAFEDTHKQQQFDSLIKELRCVTCPNQNIAESNAPVAKAIQEEIYLRIQKGERQEQIRDYLIERYGDFILYRPAIKKETWLLWFGPLVMLIAGIGLWYRAFKR